MRDNYSNCWASEALKMIGDSKSLSPAAAVNKFLTVNGSPTDYLREMLVLANELFNSPPVFAWFLPVFVRFQPGKEETFFSSVTVTVFLFFPRQSSKSSSKDDAEGGWWEGQGQGQGQA